MKFRQHRGSLAASMETVAELLPTRQAIADHLNRIDGYCVVAVSIQVRHYTMDDRIGWDTWIVTDHTGVLGFTDGPIR